MKRENLQHLLFVSTACLLSLPWLTPCVGLMSSALIDTAHNSVTRRNRPLDSLPDAQLKAWAAKPGPEFSILEKRAIPANARITDAELSDANGGMNAPRPGTAVGKSASAIVDGMSGTLRLIDPTTWMSDMPKENGANKMRRQLVLSESPYVLLQGDRLRFARAGNDGAIILAKAAYASVTVITPDGKFSASANQIHYRSAPQEFLLEGRPRVYSRGQSLAPDKEDDLMTLDIVNCRITCSSTVKERF